MSCPHPFPGFPRAEAGAAPGWAGCPCLSRQRCNFTQKSRLQIANAAKKRGVSHTDNAIQGILGVICYCCSSPQVYKNNGRKFEWRNIKISALKHKMQTRSHGEGKITSLYVLKTIADIYGAYSKTKSPATGREN